VALRVIAPEDAIQLGQQDITLSEQLHFSRGAGVAYRRISYAFEQQNNYQSAKESFLTALEIFQDIRDTVNLGLVYYYLADLYGSWLKILLNL
jgi:tetratricopeptide (TPR) repeat protein